MNMRAPDDLLAGTNSSIMLKGLIVSILLHVVLIFGTSFGLYRDWMEYGVHAPTEIKKIKQDAQRKADEAARQEAATQKSAEAAERLEEMKAIAATSAVPASAASAPAVEPQAGKETVTAPEIAPLPPKKSFSFGDDLNLD